jgi:hypothetical protein
MLFSAVLRGLILRRRAFYAFFIVLRILCKMFEFAQIMYISRFCARARDG